MSKDKIVTDVCPNCGGLNGVHVDGCTDMPRGRKSEQAQLALAVQRISEALTATPINIALAALGTVVGQAQYGLQKDRQKRERNLDVFMGTVRSAIAMTEHAEDNAKAAKLQEQTADPIRKMDS